MYITLSLILSLCLRSHLLPLAPSLTLLQTPWPYHSLNSPGMFYLRTFALAVPSVQIIFSPRYTHGQTHLFFFGLYISQLLSEAFPDHPHIEFHIFPIYKHTHTIQYNCSIKSQHPLPPYHNISNYFPFSLFHRTYYHLTQGSEN